jgi:hypothetical protein
VARIVLCLNCNLGWQISKLQKIPSRGYKCPQCISKKEPRSGNPKRLKTKQLFKCILARIMKEVNYEDSKN